MGDNFGVGLRGEDDAGGFEFCFKKMGVFDDAVMDESDAAFRIRMRMSVLVRFSAVGCPARVADADGMIEVVAGAFFEFRDCVWIDAAGEFGGDD